MEKIKILYIGGVDLKEFWDFLHKKGYLQEGLFHKGIEIYHIESHLYFLTHEKDKDGKLYNVRAKKEKIIKELNKRREDFSFLGKIENNDIVFDYIIIDNFICRNDFFINYRFLSNGGGFTS